MTMVMARSTWNLLQAVQKTTQIMYWPNPVETRFLCELKTSKGLELSITIVFYCSLAPVSCWERE